MQQKVPQQGKPVNTRTQLPARPTTSSATTQQPAISAATLVLPLRLFLAISFLAAGIDKLTDPEFFNSSAIGYIGNQLNGYAHGSPLGGFLSSVAVPNATLFGAVVLVGELAIGLGTLVGLFSRTAAFFGMLLSLVLWLTASWQVTPFFLGSDLPYAIGWLTLFLAGAHPVWSLDGWLARRRLEQLPPATRKSITRAQAANGAADSGKDWSGAPLPAANSPLARRDFVTVVGAAVFAGAVTSLAWGKTLHDKMEGSEAGSGNVASGNPSATGPQPASATTAPADSNTTTAPQATSTPVTAAGQGSASTAPATQAPATQAPAPAQTTAAAPAVQGTVVGKLSNLPVGAGQKFTTPDSGDPAILIHEKDGSVKAFSTICTHEGCEVEYVQASNALLCPCHGAAFDATNGSVLRRPARRPLQSYKVQVDGSGNIVYVQQ
ncbi:MAG TPA: TQO small subunit DoxD [Chloroflexia bacterium]|nr:TQO small subunit DoxD [Chloroflexia bacterium]